MARIPVLRVGQPRREHSLLTDRSYSLSESTAVAVQYSRADQ